MLVALMLATALTGTHPPPDDGQPRAAASAVVRERGDSALLADAIAHFRTVETYRVTLRSTRADGEQVIRYFYRKPGFVRMEFVRPHPGALLVYSPLTGRVRLWPFGAGRFPELNLAPENPLIRAPGGQTVHRSDIGALFEDVRALLAHGRAEVNDAPEAGRDVVRLVVTADPGRAVAGVHRYELWLDPATRFPVRIVARGETGAVLETVVLEDLEVNVPLSETLFNPEGP